MTIFVILNQHWFITYIAGHIFKLCFLWLWQFFLTERLWHFNLSFSCLRWFLLWGWFFWCWSVWWWCFWCRYSIFYFYNFFFSLFIDFKGYVDFFLLQDLVDSNYDGVKFFTDIDEPFNRTPIPASAAEYRTYKSATLDFVRLRNNRIAEWARNSGL